MKNKLILILATIMTVCAAGLSACVEPPEPDTGPVELNVVSPFYERVGAKDWNRDNFVNAYKAFETEQNGKVTVKDNSAESTEEWKQGVLNSFKNSTEPDVLFYYIGADANELINGSKVIKLSDIKKEYPEYASNMEISLIPTATNNMQYAVPVNGYWEGLFVNKKVLDDCGVNVDRVMGRAYTWEQFLDDCQTIKDNGKTPIAAAIGKYPHYFFEFCIMNNGSKANHSELPKTSTDAAFDKWEKGLGDIKELWDKGFFSADALTAGTLPANYRSMNSPDKEFADNIANEEVFAVESLITDGEAAFMIDGSWKIGFFNENAADHINDFAVAYVPGTSSRPSTQIISGMSMGYYITKKAWDNPKKRKACVDFITAMTTDQVVSSFGALSVTALKEQKPPANANSLEKSAITMVSGRSGEVGAVQDLLTPAKRESLFDDIKNILIGTTAVNAALKIHLGIS